MVIYVKFAKQIRTYTQIWKGILNVLCIRKGCVLMVLVDSLRHPSNSRGLHARMAVLASPDHEWPHNVPILLCD